MTRVGVIGGGQLAWMMAAAAKKLGIHLVIQTPDRTDPAVAIAADTILAAVDDARATAELARRTEVITFENEFVDLAALAQLANQGVEFCPAISALQPLLDKYDQRCFLRDHHLPTPEFHLLTAGEVPQFPIVLKTRRHGYDGQGTFIIKDASTWQATLQKLDGCPCLVEAWIPFERELAVMAARSGSGEIVVYPIVETQQQDQVCRRVIAPADLSPPLVEAVQTIAKTLLESLQYVGILGIELFLSSDGSLLVNEIAPRTHNSGHFTLEACLTSQFEQQLRAVCGLPLGTPALNSAGALMVNLLGYESTQKDYLAERQALAALPKTFVHWYGKATARPGRKLGHVTVLLEAEEDWRRSALNLAAAIEGIWYGKG